MPMEGNLIRRTYHVHITCEIILGGIPVIAVQPLAFAVLGEGCDLSEGSQDTM